MKSALSGDHVGMHPVVCTTNIHGMFCFMAFQCILEWLMNMSSICESYGTAVEFEQKGPPATCLRRASCVRGIRTTTSQAPLLQVERISIPELAAFRSRLPVLSH
jgi:hypothetical protein